MGDVGEDVFFVLGAEEGLGRHLHFGALDIAGVGAAGAGAEFFELGGEVPILESGEGKIIVRKIFAKLLRVALKLANLIER